METGLVMPEQLRGGRKMETVENDTGFSCGKLRGRNRETRKWQGGPRRDISLFLDTIYQKMTFFSEGKTQIEEEPKNKGDQMRQGRAASEDEAEEAEGEPGKDGR